ncbi:MAG: DUF2877 domain-containing protein [Egibacteraceae bacterium]
MSVAARWVSGSASAALFDVVTARPAEARVLVAGAAAVYLQVGEAARVVAVVARDGVALPNAVVVSALARSAPFAQVAPRQVARIGAGRIEIHGMVVQVHRWWDPVPRLPTADPAVLATRLIEVQRLLEPWPYDEVDPVGIAVRERAMALATAAAALRVDAAARAAVALVGLGPGFTPSGDDIVAGFLSGLRLLPEACRTPMLGGDRLAGTLAKAVSEAVAGASMRTTAPSAALLAHAARGEVARPAGRLLAALVGAAPIGGAVQELLGVGHTSGLDLATGLVIAGKSVVAGIEGKVSTARSNALIHNARLEHVRVPCALHR